MMAQRNVHHLPLKTKALTLLAPIAGVAESGTIDYTPDSWSDMRLKTVRPKKIVTRMLA